MHSTGFIVFYIPSIHKNRVYFSLFGELEILYQQIGFKGRKEFQGLNIGN